MHALRQGDVLIRPSSEKLMVGSSNVDWALLDSIWNGYLNQVKKTAEADRDATMEAVEALYAMHKLPPPRIHWFDGMALERHQVGVPQPLLMADVLFASLWAKIPEFERVIARLGYDMHQGTFRLTTNKRLLSRDFRLRARAGTRPPWARTLGNLLTQFDIPALVLYDYAVLLGCKLDSKVAKHAEALKRILSVCFGGFMFHDCCVLLDRPLQISLDPTNILSATAINPQNMQPIKLPSPAYEPRCGTTLYAVNGTIIPRHDIALFHASEAVSHLWNVLVSIRSPQVRSAMIGYMGWERFLSIVPRPAMHILDRSNYGNLIEVMCNFQHIMVVQVTNSTPEPDGSFRKYVLPVDHDCRPLPNAANPLEEMGAPQQQTALNAVASTFGMTGHEYAAMVKAES